MKKIQLIVFMLFIACSSSTERTAKDSTFEHKPLCSQTQVLNRLFDTLINIPDIQQFFLIQRESWLNEKNLTIMSYPPFTDSLSLKKFDKDVLIYSKEYIEDKDIKSYIKIDTLFIATDSIYVQFRYPIQGLGVKAILHQTNDCDIILDRCNVWEN
ncbi:MAG: hypothetical protein LBR64_04915 [Dysgonamonadaceae bacterium]|jgi:hypothetical protein|nr:hypothetical protein [Dysgonamonadaceae bacterium]